MGKEVVTIDQQKKQFQCTGLHNVELWTKCFWFKTGIFTTYSQIPFSNQVDLKISIVTFLWKSSGNRHSVSRTGTAYQQQAQRITNRHSVSRTATAYHEQAQRFGQDERVLGTKMSQYFPRAVSQHAGDIKWSESVVNERFCFLEMSSSRGCLNNLKRKLQDLINDIGEYSSAGPSSSNPTRASSHLDQNPGSS